MAGAAVGANLTVTALRFFALGRLPAHHFGADGGFPHRYRSSGIGHALLSDPASTGLGPGRNDLVQSQAGPSGNKAEHKPPMILQQRSTAAPWSFGYAADRFPALHPKRHDARTEPTAFCNVTP